MSGIVPDIPRINTAIAEWLACAVLMLAQEKRLETPKMVAGLVLSFGLMIGFQELAGMMPLILWVPGMLLAVALMYGVILVLCKTSALEAVVYTMRAFILAEFAASLEWQMHYYLRDSRVFAYAPTPMLLLVVTFALVYTVAFFVERRYRKLDSQFDVTGKIVLIALALGSIIFLLSNMSFISRNTPLSGTYASDIFLIRTLLDFCGLVMFYGIQEQRLWTRARLEIGSMHNLLDKHYQHYRHSKENIEFLNHRYHDLKHQIAVLKKEVSQEKKIEYLEKMEEAIQHFEMEYNTNHKVLDILLSSKSKQIVENGINFTCVADGTLLEGLDTIDICSIVGNALDNAIESIKKLEESEKKIMKVAIFEKNGFLIMRFENYCENPLRYEGGDIVTTKQDSHSHGFGIKSIRKAAEKYGGNIKISVDKSWFSLCVLIPLA